METVNYIITSVMILFILVGFIGTKVISSKKEKMNARNLENDIRENNEDIRRRERENEELEDIINSQDELYED